MHAARPIGAALAPALAAALALALLAAPLWPALFPAVVVGSSIAACALALARRPSRPLLLALAGIALWLALGLAGAWLLRGHPAGGVVWLLAVLYLLPLPVVPWLYWKTFAFVAGGPSGLAPRPTAADAPPNPPRSPKVNSGSLAAGSGKS
jgi:hypothetical protein